MEVIFLGTGTSQGVPMIGCNCAVCRSTDPRNQRTRASIHVIMDGLHVQIDAAPEFRLQCIREKLARLDLFVLTHGHADHIAGMGRVRAMYPYAIADRPIAKGYAAFKLAPMPSMIDLPQGTIQSTLLPHGGVTTLGLIFRERSSGRKFVYYTDCKSVPPAAMELARDADALVLDGLRPQPHPSHMSIDEALLVARDLGAAATWITHLTHLSDHAQLAATLPVGVAPAFDSLRLHL